MRKVLVLVVLTLALAIASPSMAAGPGGPGGPANGFALVGAIDNVSGTTVSVTVVAGNWPAKSYIGTTAEVQTTASTIFLLKTSTTCTRITLADLAEGDKVSVNGTVSAEGLIANRITVGAELIGQ